MKFFADGLSPKEISEVRKILSAGEGALPRTPTDPRLPMSTETEITDIPNGDLGLESCATETEIAAEIGESDSPATTMKTKMSGKYGTIDGNGLGDQYRRFGVADPGGITDLPYANSFATDTVETEMSALTVITQRMR